MQEGSLHDRRSVAARHHGVAVYPERRAFSWHVKRLNFGGRLLARRAGEPEAVLLMLICALDMYTTLWWVLNGEASEANPLLAWTFYHHPVWFVLLKCATFLPALTLVPHLGRKRPNFTRWTLRFAIPLYIGTYFIGVS
ncbi:MAG: hypothetical protein OHK0029_28670 [Armatimonadaceae bacterium]